MLYDTKAWLQLALLVALLACTAKPLGLHLMRVLDARGRTFLDPVMRPVEQGIYRLLRIDPGEEQGWKGYAVSLLVFSMIGVAATYLVLRLQHRLPLNPQKFGPMHADLAFNTAVSFVTNTNWQSYGGESTLSYFSQMVGLTLQNFVSAAVGISVAAALARGVARSRSLTIGNFWVDLVRVNLYLLLPLCLIFAVVLVSQGVIQNFKPYDMAVVVEQTHTTATGTASRVQIIPQGPVASQEAVKMLGTNGGGFTNANSAHPFENPTPLANFMQVLAILLIPSALTYCFGRMVKNQGHGWTIWGVMLAFFLAGVMACWWAEGFGNPRLAALGIDPSFGNMEGKEVRFGIAGSALFTTVTTDASCGAVNAMLDSFTPLGGLVPLLNIQLGEVVFGGVGSGLYGMLVFVVLTVFLAGLLVGRTPEYLGKKIEAYDVKTSMFYIMVPVFAILGFTACAAESAWGLAGLRNAGPHGLTELLYAFSSTTGNNGSAFAGLSTDTVRFNTVLAVAMLLGRFLMIVPVLALAGNMAGKKPSFGGSGGLPLSGLLFGGLLAGVILIVGALTFFPVLALGPIVEHLLMLGSGRLY